jgi:two-component system response regulator AgrA
MAEDMDGIIALSTGDPHELLAHVSKGALTNLYFLDVDLQSDINGIQLAEAIRKLDPRGYIVFATTHGELLPLTFKHKVEAMDYIVKDDAAGIEQKILACVRDAYAKHHTNRVKQPSYYVFKLTEQRIVSVPSAEIIYIETSARTPRKVVLHTVNGRYEYYGKLDDIEKQLDSGFFRCHKSYIINLAAVEQVDRKNHAVHLKGGHTCYAATRRMGELMRLMV